MRGTELSSTLFSGYLNFLQQLVFLDGLGLGIDWIGWTRY